MTELSPAAEAILDAALPHQVHRYAAAAALRAAADQLGEEMAFYNERLISVTDLLAIAAELESQ